MIADDYDDHTDGEDDDDDEEFERVDVANVILPRFSSGMYYGWSIVGVWNQMIIMMAMILIECVDDDDDDDEEFERVDVANVILPRS